MYLLDFLLDTFAVRPFLDFTDPAWSEFLEMVHPPRYCVLLGAHFQTCLDEERTWQNLYQLGAFAPFKSNAFSD